MNRKEARNTLINKVNDNSTSTNISDDINIESNTRNKTKNKKKSKIRSWFNSPKNQSKTIRFFDYFFKASFVVIFMGVIISFILVITSPHQFTKELIYRKNDSIVYDQKGKSIGKISQHRENGENVLNITYDDMNQALINSTVGTEDWKFFNHNGVDFLNTVENGSKTLLRRGRAGGSTITQQIIGETHIGRIGNQSIARKIREIFLSLVAETQLSKTQIITSYLNYFQFGQGNVRGVELASKWFYNKSVKDLDYTQNAILAGTLNQPSSANPLGKEIDGIQYNNSQKRLDTVLLSNYTQGYLDSSEYFLLQQVKVENTVKFNKKTTSNPYQAYIDVVTKELQEKYNVDPFIKSLNIYTNMDTDAQKYANNITKQKEVLAPNNKINFGFIVTKTQTGAITAIGGGKQYRKNGAYLFNNAIDNLQQPGSAFKPIIDYSPTFEFLHYSDRTPISNEPYKYPNTGQTVNNHDMSSGGILTMDRAIATSRNLTALRAMQAVYDKVGMDKLTEYLNALGFDFKKGQVVPAYGLGGLSFGVSPKQMNAAYQAFGNGGYYIEPWSIKSFEMDDGTIVKHTDERKRVMDEKTAFMMSTALERSTKIPGTYVGTANYTSSPYAAKTGTSNWDEQGAQYGIPNLAPKDTWLVGYTSEYTMSSWGGYDPQDIKKGYYPDFGSGGHDYSARIWGAMMTKISNGKEKSWLEMPLPNGIVKKSFDPRTPPPFKIGSYGNEEAYFYADNIPKGYSNTPAPKPKEETVNLKINLSASVGTVSASFSDANGYTPVLVVGGNSTNGSNSLSLGANDNDIVTAYYLKDGKQFATISRCYNQGNLYTSCPLPKPEPNPEPTPNPNPQPDPTPTPDPSPDTSTPQSNNHINERNLFFKILINYLLK